MLDKIFSVGNRKIVAMVLALAAILFGDKIGITMTDEMNDSIVQLVAVFTGGNVLSKFAFALLQKAAPKLPLPQLEQELPVAPGPAQATSVEAVLQYAQNIAKDTTAELNKVHGRIDEMSVHVGKTTKSVNDLILLINQRVLPAISGNQPPQPPVGPQRVPTPNELYNQG